MNENTNHRNQSNIRNESQELSLLRKAIQGLLLTVFIVSQTMNFSLTFKLQSPSSEQQRDVQEFMQPKNQNEDRQPTM